MITPAYSPTATERVLPRLALDFTTASLDNRVTVTRALNTATAVNSSGYVAIVNADLPRFDYDPVTKVCKGLLIEESRVNLLLQSQDFGNAAWAPANVSVATDALVSPDGTQNADTITSSSGAGYIYPANSGLLAAAGGGTYTLSVYAKAGTATSFQILIAGAAIYTGTFNLSAKTATTSTANTTVSIVDAGNGWCRCSVTASSVANSAYSELQIGRIASTLTLNLWGAQLEAGAFATSYIPTTTTSLTRNADVVTMTGTNFSDWYNQPEGTFVVTFTPDLFLTNNTNRVIQVSQGGGSNRVVDIYPSGTNWANYNGTTASVIGAASVTSTPQKISVAYKTLAYGYAINGGGVTAAASALVNTPNRLEIGHTGGVNFLNGHMQKIQYYKQRVINGEISAFCK